MGETLVLSPEELFCLGRLLKAEYIDYAYIAAMEGAGGDPLRLAGDTAALVKRGVLQEDFSGRIEPDPGAALLLEPIFFGGREMTVDACRLQGDRSVTAYKFHFHGDRAVMVSSREGKLVIAPADRQAVMAAVDGLLPRCDSPGGPELSSEEAVCLLVFKAVSLKGGASRVSFAQGEGGQLYREAGSDKMEAVQREDVLAAAAEMLKGA